MRAVATLAAPRDIASPVTVSTDAGETRVGEVMGTPAYMPPEQALGRTDKTTDVFALGAMLCEMLTGISAGGDLDAAIARLDNCAFDAEVVELARTCIAKDPVVRPQDAGVLATRISAYLEATQSQLDDFARTLTPRIWPGGSGRRGWDTASSRTASAR